MLRRNRVIDVFAHIRTCKSCQRLEERRCLECDHLAHSGKQCEVDYDVPDERYKGGFVAVLCNCEDCQVLTEEEIEAEQAKHADEADEAAYEAYCDAKYDEMRGN